MRRRTLAVLAIVLLTALGLYVAPRVRRFLAVDACLDHGGAWNDDTDSCEGARPEG